MLGLLKIITIEEIRMTSQLECYNDNNINPLDSVEDVLSDYNWVYSRMDNENIIVEVAGKSCQYRLLFAWKEHLNALQLRCQYDIKINPDNFDLAINAVMNINEQLWMGHFELLKNRQTPCFRHSCLIYEGDNKKFYNHIEDLVDISLIQCERYNPVFQMLASDESLDLEMLSFAMMETAGES